MPLAAEVFPLDFELAPPGNIGREYCRELKKSVLRKIFFHSSRAISFSLQLDRKPAKAGEFIKKRPLTDSAKSKCLGYLTRSQETSDGATNDL